ncbi:MAG TPA: efflux RND transporter periplasmic adaptor subunit [Oscillatoriaceae cyanobacterium]
MKFAAQLSIVLALLLVGGGATYALSRNQTLGARAIAAAPTPSCSPTTSAAGKTLYTCPMHPNVTSEHPGKCPVCGMTLVPEKPALTAPSPVPSTVTTPMSSETSSSVSGLGDVTLSPEQRVLANVATAQVKSMRLAGTLEADGQIAYDETRLQHLTAWVAGRIDRLADVAPGETIRRGQVIAWIYSPDLVSSQQEYLTALASAREMRNAPYAELAANSRALASAARQRLRLLGVSSEQIGRLESSGRPQTSMPIISPTRGVVTERKVQAGQYVNVGDSLFDLADLSHVWLVASVFENDLGQVRAGQRVEARLAAYPGKLFTGRVSAVLPGLDPATRTAQVRIELANPDGLLRPDMYASVRFASLSTGEQLAVPASAVIDTGRRHVVFVEVEPNHFVPREVVAGPRSGDYYPVVGGLKAGDKVAVSGGFLLDANAQLNAQGEPSDTGRAPSMPTAKRGGMDAMPGMSGMPGMGASKP